MIGTQVRSETGGMEGVNSLSPMGKGHDGSRGGQGSS